MIESIIVQTNAKMTSAIPSVSAGEGNSEAAGQAGQDGSSTAGFAGMLQTIAAGLNNTAGNSTTGSMAGTDGTPISIDDLIQELLNSGLGNRMAAGKKTGSATDTNDMLQQLMAQFQASSAQPVVNSSGQTGSAGTGTAISNENLANILSNIERMAATALAGGNQTDNTSGNAGGVNGNIAQNTSTGSADSLAQDFINAVALISEQSMQNTVNTAGANLNSGSNAQEIANGETTLNSGITMPDIEGLLQDIMNSKSGDTQVFNLPQNGISSGAQSSGVSGQNVMNASALTSAISGQNDLNILGLTAGVSGRNGESPAQSLIGDLKALEPSLRIVSSDQSSNNGDITSFNLAVPKSLVNDPGSSADAVSAYSVVQPQQTFSAEDAKPAQETVPVSNLSELGGPIMKTLGAGDSNLVIKLSPPDLGTIQIKLKVENGILTADFKVDSSAVKDMFTTAMPQIRQSIESSGIKTGNFFANLKEDGSSGGRKQQDANQQNTNQQQQKQNKEKGQQFFDYFA